MKTGYASVVALYWRGATLTLTIVYQHVASIGWFSTVVGALGDML